MFPLSYGSCATSDVRGSCACAERAREENIGGEWAHSRWSRRADRRPFLRGSRHSRADYERRGELEPGRIVLTAPTAEAGAKPERTAPGLSKDFARAGISELAEMWEWKGAIASAIRSGVAAGNWLGPWLQDHRVRAEGSLNRAGRRWRRKLNLIKKLCNCSRMNSLIWGSGTAIPKQPSTP